MFRLRSDAEIAEIKQRVIAMQVALYPDQEIKIAVSKFSPPRNGSPDWIITRTPKRWSDE